MRHVAILLDVEGTTVPISFVYETLFPYSRKHMETYVREHYCDPEIKSALVQLRKESLSDSAYGAPIVGEAADESKYVNSVTEYCLWLMDRDRKTAPLKTIQGRIWEQGFIQRDLQGEIFPDVFSCFSKWHRSGCRIAIYSSGSVVAQKLVLGQTPFGSLVQFIEAFFDTTVGPKKDPSSYERIAAELALNAADILFVSDVGEELNAASRAGMDVALSVRPGNRPVATGHQYRAVQSLFEL